MPNTKSSLQQSDQEKCTKTYTTLLRLLDLSREHGEKLLARGFSAEEIKKNGYKTFPIKRRELVSRLIEKVGAEGLEGVPGFWRKENGEWDLAGKSGTCIPVRDETGQIISIKIRVDKPSTPSRKYLLLSSNPKPDPKTGEIKYIAGTSAKIALHYPLGRSKTTKVLRITEGEIKADIASSLTEVYTISLPGVAAWRMALEAIRLLKPKKVLLAFDSDKDQSQSTYDDPSGGPDDKFLVGRSVASLYLSAKEAGFDVGIEDWPAEAGKGIDDVLMNGATDQIRILTEEEAEDFSNAMLIAGIPKGWVYVIGVKRFYHTESFIELDKEQFADMFCHEEKGNPAMNALRNPAMPKVDLPIYFPNRETFFSEGGRRLFNTWRKGDLQPQEGDIEPFLKHCEYILPDKFERDVLLDWLAYNVQCPGKKILWAMLLQGQAGTGKSYFGTLMRWLLGENNVSCPTNDVIHEPYTAWQKSCQLVVIEEIMARGRLELMNKLKPIITQDITIVREMFKPAYTQPNVFNLLMFTNHEDAIIIDNQDRRYCVLFSPAVPIEHAYYADLWDWTKAHKGEILDFMLKRDLSAFQPLAHAPMTEGKRTLIRESMPAIQAWIQESIESESWPFMGDLVSTTHLMQCLPGNIKWVSPQAIGKALKACGCQQIRQVKLKAGNSVRIWSVRRHEIWQGAENETLAEDYERWSMANEPGGNPMYEARPM